MSRILRTAALVVGAVAVVVATGGAAAVGIGTAAAAATATTAATAATIGGISASTLGLVASGLSLAAGLTAKKPTGTGGGSQTSWKADPQAGIPYVMGRTGVAGNIVARIEGDGWSGSTKNDLQTIVTVLSLGPVQAIESLSIDKAAVTFSGGNAVGGYHDFLFHAQQLGALPEAAAVNVAAGSSARPTGWTTAHKLSGYCATMLRLRYDSKGKHFQNGVPNALWIVQGVRVYDPRQDITYPGGSGTCRAGVESTYVYSRNPFLHALTWCIGRFHNGKRVAGIGAPVNAIDVEAFVEGANVADANGWTLGGTVYTRPDTKWNALKSMLQAGGGEPIALGAKISCMVNTTRVSLATITAADVVGEVSVTATQGRRDRKNGCWPRYRSEAHDWEIVQVKTPVRVSAYVTEDGDERTSETEYALVQDVDQVMQLGAYEVVNSREFGPITLPLKLRWLGARPGDCVTVNIPEVGLNNQLVLLLDREVDPGTGIVTFTARSETTAKHAFALGETGTPPDTPSVSGPPSTPTPDAPAWSISATSIAKDGITYPALVVTGAVDSPNADNVVFDYRVYVPGAGSEDNWISAGMDGPSTVRKEITSVTGGTQYEVSVRYRWRNQLSQTRLIMGPDTTATDSVAAGVGQVEEDLAELIDEDGFIRDGKVLANSIAAQAVTLTKFAEGLEPIALVDELPDPSGYTGAKTVSYNGKLYRYSGGAWTAAVPAVDITGQLTDAQIASLTAAKVSGQLTDAQLAAIAAAKVTGQLVNAQIADLAAGKITGQLTDAQIAGLAAAKLTGAITTTQVSDGAISTPKLAASAVTANELAANSVLATKMVLTDATNHYPDYDCEDEAFYSSIDGATITFSNSASGNRGRRIVRIEPDASTRTLVSGWFPVEISADLLVSGSIAQSSPETGQTVSFWIEFGEISGTTVTPTRQVLVGTKTNSASTTRSSTSVTTTGSERRARFVAARTGGGSSTLFLSGMRVQRRANADLIVDGAVTADKIVSNSVTTDKLASNSVTAAKIAGATITAAQLAAGAVTANELAADSVVAAKLAAGAVTTPKLAAGAVTANELAVNSVTAAKVAAATITGDKLAANTIAAKQLIVSDFSNMIPDSSLTDIANWTYAAAGWSLVDDTTRNFSNNRAIRFTGTFNDAGSNYYDGFDTAPIPVEAGKDYFYSCTIDPNSGATGTIAMSVNYCDPTGAIISTTNTYADATSFSRQEISRMVTAPSNATSVIYRIRRGSNAGGGEEITGSIYIGDVCMRRGASGELIVDGAIVASKVETGAITGTKLADGSVSAVKIASLAVETLKIADQAVTIPISAYTSGTTTVSTTTYTDVQSASITSTGAPIYVHPSCICKGSGSGIFKVRILRGSTTLWEGEVYAINTGAIPVSLGIKDTPGSGTFTYKIQVAKDSGVGAPSIDVSNRALYLLETKK